MSKFEDGSYQCLPGPALIAKVLAGRCKMNYTRAAVGQGIIPEGISPKSLTEPPDYVMDAKIAAVTNPVDGECQVTVQINSSDVEMGFYAMGILLYAEDPDLGEVPYTYLKLEDGLEWIRPASSAVGKLATFDLIAAVGAVDAVSANIDPYAIATYAAVKQLIADAVAPSGTGAPTEDTPSIVGGRYFDIATKQEYICIEVIDGKTVWRPSGSAAPSGAGAPTEETPSVVGGHYFDTEAGREYICVEVTPEGKTVWKLCGGAAKPSTGAPEPDEPAKVGDKYLDTDAQKEYVCVGVDAEGKPIWKQMIYADDLAKHDAALSAHANRRHVVAVRTRDPAMPDYGIGTNNVLGHSVILDTGDYTGTAEVSVVVSGAEYDAKNMSASGDAPDGTLILRKTEES